MRKVVWFMHVSLDGFVAGLQGEMNWIKVDEEIFEYAGRQTDKSDTAIYGRVTYQMMDGYWPTAGDEPDASKHDKQHSAWYNKVDKVVISTTITGNGPHKRFVDGKVKETVVQLKGTAGGDIVLFGSPSIGHLLTADHLVDEYWLFINPILLGEGIPLFKNPKAKTTLQLISTHSFTSGVVGLHYKRTENP